MFPLFACRLFPHPTPTDPPTFLAHLNRNLVPEVRIEVSTFYGDLTTAEARYPGLNYCYGPHRMRLGRFPHHRRLFTAFDALGLTSNEIQEFCRWEGTKWAREQYEKDEGIVVRDTTGEGIGPFVDRRHRGSGEHRRRLSATKRTDVAAIVDTRPAAEAHRRSQRVDADMSYAPPDEDAGPERDTTRTPVPAEQPAGDDSSLRRERAIVQRIISAWQSGHRLPDDIEQYLKEENERGTLGALTRLPTDFDRRSLSGFLPLASPESSSTSSAPVAPRATA